MSLTKILLLVIALLLSSCGGNSEDSYEFSSSYNSSDSSRDSTDEYEGSSTDRIQPDGDYDCTATNISRGNGPYSLGCEKDGGDVTIHFNNGGHITVDEDGYDSNTGEHWDVELE